VENHHHSLAGFGQQVRLLVQGLAELGHEVTLLSQQIPMPIIEIEGVEERRMSNGFDMKELDPEIHDVAPDACIFFHHPGGIQGYLGSTSAPANCPCFFWFPYEGSTIKDDAALHFTGMPPEGLTHLTEFARKLWQPVFPSSLVIPHGYDPRVWYPLKHDRSQLREKWEDKLNAPMRDNTFIVLNMDRNIWHKRWDATFDYIRQLKQEMPDRRIRLLAHTKMNQIQEGGHPEGFDLKKMESLYGLQDEVIYTDFDWNKGLSREELRELVLLSDLRITTSEGEGFGIPTVECAALCHPQIVSKHTALPELIGEDNPQLVEPALWEPKNDSLWAVPDVRAMVDRTLDFLADPDMQADAIRDAATYARRYEQSQVALDFEAVCKGSQYLKETAKYKYRYGFTKQAFMPQIFKAAAKCSLTLGDSVLELGSFTGDFLRQARREKVNVTGLEWDGEALERYDSALNSKLKHQALSDPWPEADVLVATDLHDRIATESGDKENVTIAFTRIAQNYDWALLRFDPQYTWGTPVIPPTRATQVLESEGMIRRYDLERIAKDKILHLQHQIWGKESNSSVIPEFYLADDE